MGNNISVDSYLNTSACGGRNITHAYLTNNGTLPPPHSSCSNAARVLKGHCCEDGTCRPSVLSEWERYEWYDWNGLGKPYVKGDGKVRMGGMKGGKACAPPLLRRGLGMGMEGGQRGEGQQYPYQQTLNRAYDGPDLGGIKLGIMGVILGGALLCVLIYFVVTMTARKRSGMRIEDGEVEKTSKGEVEEEIVYMARMEVAELEEVVLC